MSALHVPLRKSPKDKRVLFKHKKLRIKGERSMNGKVHMVSQADDIYRLIYLWALRTQHDKSRLGAEKNEPYVKPG